MKADEDTRSTLELLEYRVNLALAYARHAGSSTTGSARVIRFPIGTAGLTASLTPIPAGATVLDYWVEVEVPYSAGATLELGSAATPALLLDVGDSDLQVADTYESSQIVLWPLPGPIFATIAGAPLVGSAVVVVEYALPDP